LTRKLLTAGTPEFRILSRRAAIEQLIVASAALALPSVLPGRELTTTVSVTAEQMIRIPDGFTGLSYESSQLSHPRFFSVDNRDLIQFFRTLGDHGVLRLGGNMSEFTVWQPMCSGGDAPGETEGPDPGKGSDRSFPIFPRSIDNLVGFLDATGWKLIYGLNLARGKVDSVVQEAKYVAKAAGDRLIALQFGNEPDLFRHDGDPNQKWTYEEFIAKWTEFYTAIRAQLPNVPIAGPDTSDPRWNARFSEEVGRKIALETSHFYAEGPPTDLRLTIDYLLHPGERLQTYVMQAIGVSEKSGVPYRMAEGNTCYAAGKAGVSDTFAAALWVVDFMLTVAQTGATGVNLHGGGDGLYTPIASSTSKGYTARPIYYVMLLLQQLLGSTLLRTNVDSTGKNIAAYAARTDRALQVVLLNREPEGMTYQIVLPKLHSDKTGSVWRLEAPSVASTQGVRLAEAAVTPHGEFDPTAHELLRFRKNSAVVRLASYSAALIAIPIEERGI
jgi:hypothetical protein